MSIFEFSVFHEWLVIHKSWIGPAVCFVSLIETLAFIGYIVPGVPILFTLGMLASTNLIPLWELFVWGVVGAVLGDGISYELGHYYQDKSRRWKLLQRYPQWLFRGECFFKKHGVISIVLGRFLGPVRPIIPVIAGMMNMNAHQFYVVNILSSFVWIPVYVFPGYFVGQFIQSFREVLIDLLYLYSCALFVSASLVAMGLWLDKVTQRGYLMPFTLSIIMFLVCGMMFIFEDWSFFKIVEGGRQCFYSLEIPIVAKCMTLLRLLSDTFYVWLWTALLVSIVFLYHSYMKRFCSIFLLFLVVLEVIFGLFRFIMNSYEVSEIFMESIFPLHLSRLIFVWLCSVSIFSLTSHYFYRWLCFSGILVLFFSVAFAHYWLGTLQIKGIVFCTLLGVAFFCVMILVQRHDRHIINSKINNSDV